MMSETCILHYMQLIVSAMDLQKSNLTKREVSTFEEDDLPEEEKEEKKRRLEIESAVLTKLVEPTLKIADEALKENRLATFCSNYMCICTCVSVHVVLYSTCTYMYQYMYMYLYMNMYMCICTCCLVQYIVHVSVHAHH